MTNFQVYKKTLSFSFLGFGVDMIGLAIVAGCATAGFFIMNRSNDMAILGLIIGLVIGIIFAGLISFFVSNRIKAAQIAMMTKGVTEDSLPEDTFHEGFNEIKGRFGKIAAFWVITRAIKAIFHQISRTINKVGTMVGGDVGNSVTSAVNGAVEVLIGYLCDCCLGWILFRKEVNPFKAGCEGCVIFFRHGKTLIRNVGRIFGMGLASFALVGGALFGILVAIFNNFPAIFQSLGSEFIEMIERNGGEVAHEFFENPTNLMLIMCGIVAVVVWAMLHSVLVRPFILVGVMRNYMFAGQAHLPTEAEFQELAAKSPKFAQLQSRI